MTRSHWNTCSLCPYLDTAGDWRGFWKWFNLPTDSTEREKSFRSSPSFCLLFCHTCTHNGGASWRGEQAWPGRTARNTCNRLVLLMPGNKSSHPSPASLSALCMALTCWGASSHNSDSRIHTEDKVNTKSLKHPLFYLRFFPLLSTSVNATVIFLLYHQGVFS